MFARNAAKVKPASDAASAQSAGMSAAPPRRTRSMAAL